MFVANQPNNNILFLINNLARGGAERVFVNQINYLHREGISVYLVTLFPSPQDSYYPELILPPDRIFQLKSVSILGPFRQISYLIRNKQVTVIYSTLEWSNIIARLMKILHPKVRVVIREGSATLDSKGRISPKPVKFRLLDIATNWLVDTIIAVSPEIRRALKRYQPFYADKVKILENGINLKETLQIVATRTKAKIDYPEFIILAVASMNYYERAFEYLIDAIPLLPLPVFVRTRLVFVGDGTLRTIYQEQSKILGLESRIMFRGRLSCEALTKEYHRANVLVLCSVAEGSPNVILEAMSFGLPVITTKVGSAVNMVKDGETGFFIPFKNSEAIADKLTWLANHPQENSEMGLAGYSRALRLFSLDRQMVELKEILHLPLLSAGNKLK